MTVQNRMIKEEWVEYSPEVRQALLEGEPVVAIESSVWAQGLPEPMNYEVALEVLSQVRAAGGVPAVLFVADGKIRCGATPDELERLCLGRERSCTVKVGVGDLPGVLVRGSWGATTVSSSLMVAERLGISVLATGGVGGVHLHWNQRPDVSADLLQLSRTSCLTVCSGVKSVIDVPATLEVIESLGISLGLYQTERFPRFYTEGIETGIGVRVDSPEEVVCFYKVTADFLGRGVMLAQPVPDEYIIPWDEVSVWLEEGMRRAETEKSVGKALTPFLLDHLARASGGRTLEANRALLLANAHLATRIACILARDE